MKTTQQPTSTGGQLVREFDDVFVWQTSDGLYRIGVTGCMAIAKPTNSDWQGQVKAAIDLEGEAFEETLYSLMEP